ncbi:MAG: Hint domain-containing protein [Hasllibacter sp.]
MPLTWNAIYLANILDLDSNESTLGQETTISGTAGSAANPIGTSFTQFTVNDTDGDNIWDRDNTGQGNETATRVENGVTDAVNLDSVMVYNSTITYTTGGTANITAVMIQLTNGDIYLVPEYLANADNDALNAAPIQSITLNSVSNNGTNLVADRQAGNFVPCFEASTRIAVPGGRRAAGDLAIGDLVATARGPQPVLWAGRRRVRATGANAPVRFAPGALGNAAALLVSPNHRRLVTGWRAQLLFGEDEVLVPAKALVDGVRVTIRPSGAIDYVHLLTPRHAILDAEGAAAESFHPGAFALDELPVRQRLEVLAALPCAPADYAPAAPVLRLREAMPLAA